MSTHVLACAAGTVLLLSACATSPHGWARSDTPHTQVAADKAQCEYEAKKATASYSTTPTEEDRKKTGGLGAAVADGIVIAEKQIALTNECMALRGYRKQ